MGTDLKDKFYNILQKHLQSGLPLEVMNFTPMQKRRAQACIAASKALKENEMMDIDRYLRVEWGRTFTEIRQDKRVIDFIMNEVNGDSRELSRYRIKKVSERVMRMASNAGNMKMMIEGSKMLYKAEGLDRTDEEIDAMQGVNELPALFTSDPSKINSNLRAYSEEEREKLRRKYHVERDKTMEMVEAKKGFYVQAGTEVTDEELDAMQDGNYEMYHNNQNEEDYAEEEYQGDGQEEDDGSVSNAE